MSEREISLLCDSLGIADGITKEYEVVLSPKEIYRDKNLPATSEILQN